MTESASDVLSGPANTSFKDASPTVAVYIVKEFATTTAFQGLTVIVKYCVCVCVFFCHLRFLQKLLADKDFAGVPNIRVSKMMRSDQF